MNFTFTIMAHGFDKAAKLEASLKELGIPYDVSMAKPVNGKRTRKPRAVIDKLKLGVILSAIDKHPTWNATHISKDCGVGRSTVERIMAGKHVLQQPATEIR
jgi:hypothetical protein